MDYINEILSQNNKNRSEKWISENFPTFHLFISSLYTFDASWKEKLYLHINEMKISPICYCGNNVQFVNISKGYRRYCSRKCLSNDSVTKEKRKSTCIQKYGVDNPMKNVNIMNSYNKSIKDKYNVDNVSTLDITKEKVRNTNFKKFGVNYVSQRVDIREILSDLMTKRSLSLNKKKGEILSSYLSDKVKIYDIEFISISDTSIYNLKCSIGHLFEIHKNTLNDRISNINTICTICNPIDNESDSQDQLYNFIESIYDGYMIKNDRTLKFELDIFLPNNKIAFEFNGVYWHSDKYKDKNYHLNKTNLCAENNIQLIHIWEDDWKNKRSIVESRIKNLIGKSNRIWARLCDIKEVHSKEKSIFLQANHIQGDVISKYNIGLYYKSELVSLMTFGSLRKSLGQKSTSGNYELLRFCNKINFSIVGGASRIFKYFIKSYDPISVISYADRCWSNGNLYRRLGFADNGNTKPNYYYVVNGIRKNRFNYRKNILVKEGYDITKTEFEIMSERKINKIYDSGNHKFVYNRK